MSLRIRLLLLLLCGLATAYGEAEQPPPDFSDGFAKLADLGLPAIPKEAKWIALTDAHSAMSHLSDSYEIWEMVQPLKGMAWLLPGEGEAREILPLAAVSPVPAPPESLRPAKRGLVGRLFGGKEKDADSPAGENLEKDVDRLIDALAKESKKEADEPMRDYEITRQSATLGPLILFAAQIHQHGQPDLANRLAAAIFRAAASPEACLDDAISRIAAQAYRAATDRFFQDYDWQAYHDEVKGLLEKFPRGWSERYAVAMLLPGLAAKVADPAVPDPQPISEKEAFDPAMLEIVRSLAVPESDPPEPQTQRQRHQDYDQSPAPWLLEEPSPDDQPAAGIDGLKRFGIDALPLLAALATDTHLLPLPNPNVGSSSSRFGYSSRQDEMEIVLALYQNLPRPATRGDFAARLLLQTLPQSDRGSRNNDPVGLAELARDFHSRHKDANRDQLAVIFLEEGSHEQQQAAAGILANSKSPEAHKAFESHILNSDSPTGQIRTVQIYVTARKAAAKPFLDDYSKLIHRQIEDLKAGGDDNSYELRQTSQIVQLLGQLERLASGESPAAMARSIARGDPEEAEAAIMALFGTLSEEPPLRQLHTLLAGASAAEAVETRENFLKMSFRIQWPRPEDPESDADPPDRELSETEIKVWQKLLADERPITDSVGHDSSVNTAAALASLALEYSIQPSIYQRIEVASHAMREMVAAILLDRVRARLAGETLPEFPDATKVSTERIAEIVRAAGAKASDEVHPYLETLNPDERAAWMLWLGEPGDLALPKSVADLQWVVTRRTPQMQSMPDVPGAGGIDVGFELSAKSLAALIDRLAADMENHSRVSLIISPVGFGPGASVIALREPAEPADERAKLHHSYLLSGAANGLEMQEEADAVIYASLQSATPRGRADCLWQIRDGKAELTEDSGDRALTELLDQMSASNEPVQFYFRLQILTRADADALSEY